MHGRFLVTGAAGFIGSHLVDYLLEQKVDPRRITLLILATDSLENLPSKPFTIVRGDIRNPVDVQKAMRGVDTVFHLAARIDFDGRTYAEYESVNVTGTQNIIDACVGKQIKKFVLYSSIGVFGMPAAVGPIEGWDETHPKTFTNFYGRSKWEAEQRVRQAHRKFGLPYAIIRPASVYGPREKGPTLALYRAIYHHRFLMVGTGKNLMHYVYVTDLVRATYLAAQSKRTTGEYIIAGAKPTKFSDVIASIAGSISTSVPRVSLPTALALGIAYCFQLLGTVLKFKPPIFPSRVRTMTTTYYYSIDKAKTELKYAPKVSFAQGAKLTGAWYLSQGWLK